jgi:CDP-glucose 4,6-dehydratase
MTSPFGGVYSKKRVFVTGNTGFKGSWLTLWLQHLGAEVLGYSLDIPTTPSLFKAVGLDRESSTVFGDIRDYSKLAHALQEFKPEWVFHLAAQPLVLRSYDDPVTTFETNVIGTVNLLEAIRAVPSVHSATIVTTDKCYENNDWVYGYREIDQLGGRDPYSSSKACAELVVRAYRDSFFSEGAFKAWSPKNISSVRAGNVIGGGDWASNRLVPDCIRSLTQGEPIRVRHPSAVRPWQYVLEPLSGYLWLGAKMLEDGASFGESWNFGPPEDDCLRVDQVIAQVLERWGNGEYIVEPEQGSHEARMLRLDASKARLRLDWRPVFQSSLVVRRSRKPSEPQRPK